MIAFYIFCYDFISLSNRIVDIFIYTFINLILLQRYENYFFRCYSSESRKARHFGVGAFFKERPR